MEVLAIDINCDMGESFGLWTMGADDEVMPNITSANVACGAHAGDPRVMRLTVRAARAHGVSVGAHPGFADLQGFGRREMQVDPSEIEDSIIAQVGALAAIGHAEGVPLRHVKAHGALTWRSGTPSACPIAASAPTCAMIESSISDGSTCISRRPNPWRSANPGCAPTDTPCALAARTVRRMTRGSPAWAPHATLAEVMFGMTSSSAPIVQRPNDSPMSQLMSIARTSISRRTPPAWTAR